jgi:pilus assembly protein CpaC
MKQFFLILAIFLAMGLHAQAQQQGVSKPLTLTVGKAQTIDFNEPIAEVLVANPGIVDVGVLTKKRLYVVGNGVGDTNVLVFDQSNNTLASMDVNVAMDQNTLQRALRQYFPEEKIAARTLNREVVLTGKVSNPSKAGQVRDVAKRFVGANQTLVDLMTVEGEQQVMMQVKIVEVRRNVLKEYSLDPDIAGTGLGNFNASNVASTIGGKITGTPFSIGSLIYETQSHGPISLTIQALEEKGLLNTLAEPNMTAISGQRAEFLAGGEYPIPVAQQNNQITIEFKKFGVALGFTPVVLTNDKIQLELETEVSLLSNEGRLELADTSIPSLSVRRAKTTVEMASGGSLMIAGLIQSDAVNSMNSLPGINKVPIIGKLFSSQSFRRNESELLVMVTPYLVRPIKNPAATRTVTTDNPNGPPVALSRRAPVNTSANGFLLE